MYDPMAMFAEFKIKKRSTLINPKSTQVGQNT